MAQGQASRPGTGGCVTKGGLSLVGAEQVDFEQHLCCSRVMSCGSAGEAGLLPVTLCGWHHSGGKQETCGMRLGGSTAPKSLQVSILILSHKLCPCLCKRSVAQTIEGSVLQGHPRTLWLMCAAGSSVLGAGLFFKPSPHAQAGPGSPTACCPRPWGQVIWCMTVKAIWYGWVFWFVAVLQ